MKGTYCFGGLMAAILCSATCLYAQDPLDPPNPQTAPATQNANGLQDSQNRDLQSQPGLFDSQQDRQNENLDQPLAPPQPYDQRGQEQAAGNRSTTGGARQFGETGSQGEAGGMSGGRPGELGVFLVDAAGPGVRIRQTVTGSAADEAGLEPGDVILQVDGSVVEGPSEVTRLVRGTPAGQSVTLHILRNGAEQQVAATLQPAGDRYRTSFRDNGMRGTSGSQSSGDLESRTRKLEQQLVIVMRQLDLMNQQIMQLRGSQRGAAMNTGTQSPPGGLNDAGFSQPSTPQSGLEPGDPSNVPPPLDDNTPQTPPADDDVGLPF